MSTKTTIPKKTKEEINQDQDYNVCMLYGHHGHICGGRLTKEHTIIFAGKSYQAKWSIISLCARGHGVDEYQDNHEMRKDLNVWVALNRASEDELKAISKAIDYCDLKTRLNGKYGVWEQKSQSNLNSEVNQARNYMKKRGEEMIGNIIDYLKKEEPKAEDKPFWYNVPVPERHKIQECIDFFKEAEDKHFTPYQMIAEAIRSYHEEITRLKEITK